MEKEDSRAIAEAFADVLSFSEFAITPPIMPKLEKVLERTFIPVESKQMQFEVKAPLHDSQGININTQYEGKPEESPTDIILMRIVTNYKTDYSAGVLVRWKRRTEERKYEQNLNGRINVQELEKPAPNESHAEIICRIARNNPKIWGLMEESYSRGFRYSGMGYQEIRYASEREGNIWVKMPIFGIPGIFEKPGYHSEEEKDRVHIENMKKASIIFNFSRRHQIPKADFLEANGYKSEAVLKK